LTTLAGQPGFGDKNEVRSPETHVRDAASLGLGNRRAGVSEPELDEHSADLNRQRNRLAELVRDAA
jgi:hypothetical protein